MDSLPFSGQSLLPGLGRGQAGTADSASFNQSMKPLCGSPVGQSLWTQSQIPSGRGGERLAGGLDCAQEPGPLLRGTAPFLSLSFGICKMVRVGLGWGGCLCRGQHLASDILESTTLGLRASHGREVGRGGIWSTGLPWKGFHLGLSGCLPTPS